MCYAWHTREQSPGRRRQIASDPYRGRDAWGKESRARRASGSAEPLPAHGIPGFSRWSPSDGRDSMPVVRAPRATSPGTESRPPSEVAGAGGAGPSLVNSLAKRQRAGNRPSHQGPCGRTDCANAFGRQTQWTETSQRPARPFSVSGYKVCRGWSAKRVRDVKQ